MKFWQTSSFKTLQDAWYERLEDEGFVDIEERLRNGEMALKNKTPQLIRPNPKFGSAETYFNFATQQIADREAYFHFVAQQVEVTVWTSDVDKLILSRHAEGRKIRHICDELKDLGHIICRRTVRVKIRRYEMAWGIRIYTPQQLNIYSKTA